MIYQDIITTLIWWVTWFILGWAGWPLSRKIFSGWHNQGYLLAKAVGSGIVTYFVWWLGMTKLVPFSFITIIGVILTLWITTNLAFKSNTKTEWKTVISDELIFLVMLFVWVIVKGHEPTINGLEKFMDFGFTRSILQGSTFPPSDMWYAGETINYYYFGHLLMAVATKLSGINLGYTFNLMLATTFALCMSMSYAIMRELLVNKASKLRIFGSWLGAGIVSLGGNLHTIYAFTKGYSGDNPPPFWAIWSNFSDKLNIINGWRAYWYPNATRFIPFTIHEFPSYSFVVSDMHGHVLSIPFSLTLIAIIVTMFLKQGRFNPWIMALYGWIASWSMMTNALDGPIYMGILGILVIWFNQERKSWLLADWWKTKIRTILPAIIAFVIGLLPFLLSFKPFVSGIAVNCPPKLLENSRIGPIIFETVDKCQKSPLWMLLVLWGFFLANGVALFISKPDDTDKAQKRLLLLLGVVCTGLILFTEFLYFKDIYPLHFRSNTMFKLGYQAFMILGLLSGYTITTHLINIAKNKLYWTIMLPMLFLVMIYPYFAIKSYFGDLRSYKGIYGLSWIWERYPDDAAAISWLQTKEPAPNQPVILEANGDSYTDYDRISTFTGLPTIAGWTVHEWLWRGGYTPIADRAEEVRKIYESTNAEETRTLLSKYKVKYVVIGSMERQKYTNLNEEKWAGLGEKVFTQGTIDIYKIYY